MYKARTHAPRINRLPQVTLEGPSVNSKCKPQVISLSLLTASCSCCQHLKSYICVPQTCQKIARSLPEVYLPVFCL